MPGNPGELDVRDLGHIPYPVAWELQRTLQKQRIVKEIGDTLLLCEHDPVITIGKSGTTSNVLASEAELAKHGIAVFEVERGGDVTYHGPGQLVAYPILDLSLHRRDVHWYMRMLEEVVIRTLQEFEIIGLRIPGKTGVWTQPLENAIDFQTRRAVTARKIASLGVRISRWCTMHGVALNVSDCTAGFRFINPCGFTDVEMTSVQQEVRRLVTLDDCKPRFVRNFISVFSVHN